MLAINIFNDVTAFSREKQKQYSYQCIINAQKIRFTEKKNLTHLLHGMQQVSVCPLQTGFSNISILANGCKIPVYRVIEYYQG
jgi:hypothetical protein